MTRPLAPALLALGVLVLHPAASAAAPNTAALDRLVDRFRLRLDAGQGPLYRALRAGPHPVDDGVQLMFVDERGFPRYYGVDNVVAAQTVSTDHVHPGGGFGFTLTGSGTTAGRLAIWDGGAVRTSHQEFGGRAVQADGAGSFSSHATHVSGTMIAAGVNAAAKGMSYQARLDCYDWNSDNAEMATAAAAGLSTSNHSYGFVTGWRWSGSAWYWYGDMSVSATEDYGFGFYSAAARDWDQIAYDAPEYLIVASAGNDRNDAGPGPGGTHFHWDGSSWVSANDTHDPDGGAEGWDTVAWFKTAKNILAIGAVEDVPGGYAGPGSVAISSFSGFGPADDGRVKPDLVANGVGLTSSTASSNTSYSSYSGTSMASPNASGSINLVREHWETTHGAPPRAATLKAILVQTADECGTADGPDYRFGWGLLNTLAAAQLVSDDLAAPPAHAHVWEAELAQGETDVYYLDLPADGPVTLTLAWTDVPGTPVPPALDPTDPMLVNDLDLRLDVFTGPARAGAAPWEPWILDPANPGAAAATGDNTRDNVEKIDATDALEGLHVVVVTHKGTLVGGPQAYSLASSAPITVVPPPVAAPRLEGEGVARTLALAVSPNPFRAAASIAFDLPAPGDAELTIHDVAGRLVRSLASGPREAGAHRVAWDGRDAAGRPLAAGVYFARLATPDGVRTERVVRLTR